MNHTQYTQSYIQSKLVYDSLHRVLPHTSLSVGFDWLNKIHVHIPAKKQMWARGKARGSNVKRVKERERELEKERKVQDASLCYFCHVERIYSLHIGVLISGRK